MGSFRKCVLHDDRRESGGKPKGILTFKGYTKEEKPIKIWAKWQHEKKKKRIWCYGF